MVCSASVKLKKEMFQLHLSCILPRGWSWKTKIRGTESGKNYFHKLTCRREVCPGILAFFRLNMCFWVAHFAHKRLICIITPYSNTYLKHSCLRSHVCSLLRSCSLNGGYTHSWDNLTINEFLIDPISVTDWFDCRSVSQINQSSSIY